MITKPWDINNPWRVDLPLKLISLCLCLSVSFFIGCLFLSLFLLFTVFFYDRFAKKRIEIYAVFTKTEMNNRLNFNFLGKNVPLVFCVLISLNFSLI